ncbi:TPA: hypothetical protein ACS3A9_003183 [Klebsiella pneumoniae]
MAAQRLGIPDRQCRRLLSRYNQSGPLSMPNLPRGRARFRRDSSWCRLIA